MNASQWWMSILLAKFGKINSKVIVEWVGKDNLSVAGSWWIVKNSKVWQLRSHGVGGGKKSGEKKNFFLTWQKKIGKTWQKSVEKSSKKSWSRNVLVKKFHFSSTTTNQSIRWRAQLGMLLWDDRQPGDKLQVHEKVSLARKLKRKRNQISGC